MKIFNLTQHPATPVQIEAGVTGSLTPEQKEGMNFDSIPSQSELKDRAENLARIVGIAGFNAAMIGGAPFFMRPLEVALEAHGIQPLYAFSVRKSVEKEVDGKVTKVAIFEHQGFVGK